MVHQRIGSALIMAMVAFVAGCQEDSSGPQQPSVTVSVVARGGSVGKSAAAGVAIASAKVLLKSVSFHSALSDDSADVETGSMAVTLNVAGGLTQVLARNVRPGTYDRVRFRLHKPEDLEPIPDPEFRIGTSGNDRFSVIVQGTSSGVPFKFRSNESADQELFITPPLVVPADGTTNLTLVVDVARWFQGPEGPLDPLRPEAADLIEENIKASFREAFPDGDRDGIND